MKTLKLSSICIATALVLAACGGGSSSAPTSVNAGLYTENAYVAGTGTIYQFSINTSGGLVPLATASVAAGAGAVNSVAVTPNKLYVYAASSDGHIYQYAAGSDGSLTPIALAASVPTLSPFHIVIDSTSSYLYVSNGAANTISEFNISAVDGSLSPAAGSPVATGTCGAAAGLALNATTLYVAAPSKACSFTVAPLGGALSAVATKAAGTATNKWLALGSKALYVTDSTAVYQLSKVSGTTYSLPSPISAATAPTPTSTTLAAAAGMAFSSTALYAASTLAGVGQIAQYSFNAATAALTPLTPATVTGLTGAVPYVGLDATSQYVYAVNQGAASISQYTVGSSVSASSNGALVPNATPTVTGVTAPNYIAFR